MSDLSSPPRLDPSIPIILYTDECGWGDVGTPPGSRTWHVPSGTAGYVVMLARGLRRRGYRVAAICQAVDTLAPMRAMLREAGVEVYAIEGGTIPLMGHLRRQRTFVSHMRHYRGGILALLMGYFTSGGGALLAGTVAGAGAVVRADLTGPEPPIPLKQRIALRLKDCFVDRIVVGAMDNREAFTRLLGRSPSKIEVIHTGIELQRFQPGEGRAEVRKGLGYTPDHLVVGAISRLSDERKGLTYFLQMAAHVAAVSPQARFLIVGDGVARPRLERRAEQLGIGDRVLFAGWRTDVPKILAATDVFVMPSLSEGGPTVVLEAMAMGRPVAATRVGMVPEVIEQGETGLIVEPGNSLALAEAVVTLLHDDVLRTRLGEGARAKAERSFAIDRMVDRYLQTFAAALAHRTSLASWRRRRPRGADEHVRARIGLDDTE